ncbi:membrane-anchored mycosin MYCP [Haloechinothrix alba]|uniref:Membrane-anchored mycosin MYCP n=2 Tax=Haloechinothrix alba TaxID=664784 RepID=A0A238YL50_9PSEU|nr:membrane-anchored mycosin MYCP [Haloechinothrix alba]
MHALGRRTKRAVVVLFTAAFGLVAAGAFAPISDAHVGWAEEDERPAWAPPPPSEPPPSANDGEPDQRYTQDQECVQRAGDLDEGIRLKNIPWGQMHLRIDDVHEYMNQHAGSVGDGKTVAVIDTGVTPHPFLEDRLEGGGDYVQGDDGLEDCDGHGTQVAGIIAADSDSSDIGFTGVAPDARILSIRQSSQNFSPESDDERERRELLEEAEEDEGEDAGETDPESANQLTHPGQDDGSPRVQGGAESAGDLTTLAQSVRLAADTDGVEVINMSVDNCRRAGDAPITTKERKLQSAVRYAVDEKDIVVVAAAGNVNDACRQNDQPNPNDPRTIVSPSWFSEDLLAVAAIDRTGGVAPFSMNGPWISVAAPGTEITSLDPAEGSSQLANLTIEGGNEVPLQGTSFAAPYVAGLAVLVRQMHPDLDAREVMHRITSTAQHPGSREGHDQFTGHGVINPMAALTATVPEEEGIEPASDVALPSDMPAPGGPDPLAVTVALAGAAGGVSALGVTLFVIHAVRRSRRDSTGDLPGDAA